ncbi:MAG: restriction endonuclease [Alphaproteobacteria bacterium]
MKIEEFQKLEKEAEKDFQEYLDLLLPIYESGIMTGIDGLNDIDDKFINRINLISNFSNGLYNLSSYDSFSRYKYLSYFTHDNYDNYINAIVTINTLLEQFLNKKNIKIFSDKEIIIYNNDVYNIIGCNNCKTCKKIYQLDVRNRQPYSTRELLSNYAKQWDNESTLSLDCLEYKQHYLKHITDFLFSPIYDKVLNEYKEKFNEIIEETINSYHLILKNNLITENIISLEDFFSSEEVFLKKWQTKIKTMEQAYRATDKDSIDNIISFCIQNLLYHPIMKSLLLSSKESKEFELTYSILYDSDAKTFIINLDIPPANYIKDYIGMFHQTINMLISASKNSGVKKEFKLQLDTNHKKFITNAQKPKEFNKLYDSIISQLILLVVHIVFKCDYLKQIETVCVNGFVAGIDQATGADTKNCIVSVSVNREIFSKINLEKIDPMVCLKSLKARIASEFVNLAPVNPIIIFDKNDKRFTASQDIIDNTTGDTNLAIMEWEKFEHLVRDLFSKMFAQLGAEVKITQASRDRGVDAIVFDPDPIRGGKIVIQCKRYNNVVGVDAVRDLYGTVQHEGANKGILVTTSHFGGDSIEWSKDKPITLINGQELLFWFQKYGYNFKIELQK